MHNEMVVYRGRLRRVVGNASDQAGNVEPDRWVLDVSTGGEPRYVMATTAEIVGPKPSAILAECGRERAYRIQWDGQEWACGVPLYTKDGLPNTIDGRIFIGFQHLDHPGLFPFAIFHNKVATHAVFRSIR